MMGFDPGDNPRYQISQEDARTIKAYQVCKAFNCLDIDVYRRNPGWWNNACYALVRTENKAQQKLGETNG